MDPSARIFVYQGYAALHDASAFPDFHFRAHFQPIPLFCEPILASFVVPKWFAADLLYARDGGENLRAGGGGWVGVKVVWWWGRRWRMAQCGVSLRRILARKT